MQRNILVDLLRILLLVWIVLFHYTVRYNEIYADTIPFPVTFENGGTVGVALFFIISGFFMAPSLFRSEHRGAATFASYCGRRFMRFWPLYIICCLAIVGSQVFLSAGERDCTLLQFFQNLFIVHILGAQRVDGAHWFLETLLLIQFIFALALFVPRKKRLNILMIIVGVNILFSLLFVATDIKIFDRIAKIIGGRHYLWCAFIGIILFLIINRKQTPIGTTNPKSLVAAYTIAAATWIVVFVKLGFCIWFPVYTVLFVVALTWHPQIPARIATFITAGGSAMLAWYLVHQNIGYAIILSLKTRGADPWLMIAAAACVTFVLALVCIRIERGIKKLIPSKKR